MVIHFIKQWEKRKHLLREYFSTTPQSEFVSYKTIFSKTLELVVNFFDDELDYELDEDTYGGYAFDLKAITEIDNGEYQGTLLFIVPRKTYQPSESDYVITSVYYGSCSQCDTLQGIRDCESRFDENYDEVEFTTSKQVDQYMTLALHMVQRMRFLYPQD